MRYLLTLVTVTDNISQNTLIEYLMINNIFETLLMVGILRSDTSNV